MKVNVEIDFSEMFLDDVALSELIREEISNELRKGIKGYIKKDKRFSQLLSDSAELFFNSIKLIRK